MALHNLMEGISNRLDIVVESEPPPEESLNDKATRLAQAWDWSVSGLPSQSMEQLAMIPKVTEAGADIASEISTPVFLL